MEFIVTRTMEVEAEDSKAAEAQVQDLWDDGADLQEDRYSAFEDISFEVIGAHELVKA